MGARATRVSVAMPNCEKFPVESLVCGEQVTVSSLAVRSLLVKIYLTLNAVVAR